MALASGGTAIDSERRTHPKSWRAKELRAQKTVSGRTLIEVTRSPLLPTVGPALISGGATVRGAGYLLFLATAD